jgi:hypothetical protein
LNPCPTAVRSFELEKSIFMHYIIYRLLLVEAISIKQGEKK